MRDFFKISFSTVKIAIPLLVLTITITGLSDNWLSLTAAWFNSQVTAVSNYAETGYWTPATPTQKGWNLATESDNPNDLPVDLACGSITNGGDPKQPRAAFNWTEVEGSNIIYQREVTYPDEHTNSNFFSTSNYTGFASFGLTEGIDGVWKNRVRAFEDVNDNGVYDEGVDAASDWSDYCQLTLDTTGPVVTLNSFEIREDDGKQILSIKGSITDNNPDHYWLMAEDDSGNQVLDFPGTVYHSSDITNQILYDWDISSISGNYTIKLEAEDEVGNQSQIFEEIVITQTSETTVTVTNSPTKAVKNVVANGSFEQDLESWQTDDDITLVASSKQAQLGQRFAQLSYDQTITQTLDNSGQGIRSVGFWYQIAQDNLDNNKSISSQEPSLAVYANGQMMAQFNLDTSNKDWQFASIYLADIKTDSIKLDIANQSQDSVVNIDNVNTQQIIVNPKATFTLQADRPEFTSSVVYQYRLNNRLIKQKGKSGLEFHLQGQPDNGLVEYWSINDQGRIEDKKQFQVWLDYQHPSAISDLKVYQESENQYSLSFTAPYDNWFPSVRSYDIRYSCDVITSQTNWDSLEQVHPVANNEFGINQQAPLPTGLTEEMWIDMPHTQQDCDYYFAIKAIDQASNYSYLSNVVQTESFMEPTVYVDSPIVINEIMYFPQSIQTGSDLQPVIDHEWVELYNPTDKPIDVSGWWLQDKSGKTFQIDDNNVDNNGGGAQKGTVVPSEGWLVVINNGRAIFNNDGDIVDLYHRSGGLVDSYYYQGGVEPGLTEGRKVDGQNSWSLASTATPGFANVADTLPLKPKVEITNPEPFNAQINVSHAQSYQTAQYELTYTHIRQGQPIIGGAKGQFVLSSDKNSSNKIYFATCTSGGVCVPHESVDPDSIQVKVWLIKANQDLESESTIELEADFHGDWLVIDEDESNLSNLDPFVAQQQKNNTNQKNEADL